MRNTSRTLDVRRKIIRGWSLFHIAAEMSITPATVRTHAKSCQMHVPTMLTDYEQRQIKRKANEGQLFSCLAKEYGCTEQAIGNVIAGTATGKRKPNLRTLQILQDNADGKTQKEICAKHRVSRQWVSAVLRGAGVKAAKPKGSPVGYRGPSLPMGSVYRGREIISHPVLHNRQYAVQVRCLKCAATAIVVCARFPDIPQCKKCYTESMRSTALVPGTSVGKWTITGAPTRIKGNMKYPVVCTCGLRSAVTAGNLLSGKSAGCRACSTKQRWANHPSRTA